ncbi:unnamed protein product [Amoebophrya sp. A120]|nr:unnamed protein product [Amoebophrya sp. A120]|eukprot:GSA120T00025943001.1
MQWWAIFRRIRSDHARLYFNAERHHLTGHPINDIYMNFLPRELEPPLMETFHPLWTHLKPIRMEGSEADSPAT